MRILWRLIIILGCAGPGLALGMLWAARSGAAAGSGLAGGAIVLGYGVLGAVIAAVLGFVISLRLSDTALARAAGILGIILVALIAYAMIALRSQRNARLDPPEAYEGIPSFALTMERTDMADPVLAKRVSVDSKERIWETTLPDGRVCSAQGSAEALKKCTGNPEQVLSWRIDSDTGPSEGRVELNTACLTTESDAQYLLFSLQQVTLTSGAPVDCDP